MFEFVENSSINGVQCEVKNHCENVIFTEKVTRYWNGEAWETEIVEETEEFEEAVYEGRSLGDMISYNTAAIQDLYNEIEILKTELEKK